MDIFQLPQADNHSSLPIYIFCEMNLKKYFYFVSTKCMHACLSAVYSTTICEVVPR